MEENLATKNRRSHQIAANANSVERVELAEFSIFGLYMTFKCQVVTDSFLSSESAIHYVLFFQLMPLDGMLDDPATKAASEPSPPSFPMQMRRTRITTSAAKSSLSILSRCNPLDKSRENACHIMSHHFDIQ